MSHFGRGPARRWTADELAQKRFRTQLGKSLDIIEAGERANRQPMVVLVIPFPPSTNHDKAPNGQGGQYLTPAARAFRASVSAVVQLMRSPWVKGPYTVAITLYPPDRRAYDIDNRVKPTLDALQGAGVIENDRQVKRIIVSEATVKAGGEAIVTVEGVPL